MSMEPNPTESESDFSLVEALLSSELAAASPVAPLARPTQSLGPRIPPKKHLIHGAPTVVAKSSPCLASPRPSGDPLERPAFPSSHSAGPRCELSDLATGSLQRPSISIPSSSVGIPSRTVDQVAPPSPDSSAVPITDMPIPKAIHLSKRRRTSADVTHKPIQRVRKPSETATIQLLIPRFLICYACFSDLLTRLQSSPHGNEHFSRILDGCAPSTILRYLTCLLSLFEVCRNLQVDLHSLDDIGLADLLMTGASEAGKFSAMTVKAIRWAWKQFHLNCFKACFDPIVSSFCKTKFITDRRESLPLPLLVIIQWERRILQSAASIAEVLILGTFLLMTFSGMRFGDIQRVIMHRLQYDSRTIRGISWKTKTCNSGVPFGIICSGFLSKGSFHWAHKFFSVLDNTLSREDPEQIDFILPSCPDGQVKHPVEAMTYAEALFYLRKYMHLPWRSKPLVFDNAVHYTVHGLKSTFLSWASQLRLDPEDRRLQGHHKDPLQSTRLYSRDDINGSLFLQESIIQRVVDGWRPQTPLSRGGQLPLQEPQVILESFQKTASDIAWTFFAFNKPPEILIMPEDEGSMNDEAESSQSSSDSSSESSSSAATAAAALPQQAKAPVPQLGTVDEVEMGSYRNTIHVIMDWGAFDTPEHHRRIRTACGRLFPSANIQPHSEWKLHSGKTFCTHPGCRKGWIAVGALS